MIPYYVLVGAPLLFSLCHALRDDRPGRLPRQLPKKNYTILLFFVLYFLLLALRREDIGTDFASYIRSFTRFRDYTWGEAFTTSRWEAGFVVLAKLIGIFTASPQVYAAIIAALCVFPVARLYYHESEDDVTVMALFTIFPVFLMNFSGLRQAIAIAFAPAVYYAARERKLVRAILLSLAATLFHTSGVTLLLLYPVYHMKLRAGHLLWIAPVFAFSYVFKSSLYFLLLPLFGSNYASRYAELSQTGATTMLILFALFTLYAFWGPNDEQLDEDTRGLRNLMVLVLFIQVFASISTLAMRLNYYFLVFIPLLIPRISHRITRMDVRYVQLIRIGIAAFFVMYYYIKIHTQDGLNIHPYAFFWQ